MRNHLDESFDMSLFSESLFVKVKRKFGFMGSSKNLNPIDVEDMMQDWWVNKLRKTNETFINRVSTKYYNKLHYKENIKTLSDNGNEKGEWEDVKVNETISTEIEMSNIYDLIKREFGETLTNMFIQLNSGYCPTELEPIYNINRRTIYRKEEIIRKWLNENLK